MTVPTRTPLGSSTYARDWYLDVEVAGVWTPVLGVTQFVPPPVAINSDTVQTMNGGGWDFPMKLGQAWAGSVTVARKISKDADPVYDPGQEALRAAADAVDSLATLRWYKMDGLNVEAFSGIALIQWAPGGGGKDDLDSATVTITGQGVRTPITHPAAG